MHKEAKINHFPGYTVFSDGRVWSEKRSQFLKPWENKDGYHVLNLSNAEGERKSVFVHRLVLLAFKGEDSKEANHIDGNRKNNVLENLEYCERQKNLEQRFLGKRRFVTHLKKTNKYQAQVWVKNKLIHLGNFEDKEQAYSHAHSFYVSTFGKEPWSKNA